MRKLVLFILVVLFALIPVMADSEYSGGVEFSCLIDKAQIESTQLKKANHIKVSADFMALFDKSFFIGGEISTLREIDEGNSYHSLAIYQIDPSFIFGFQLYSFSWGMRGTYEIPFNESGIAAMSRQKNEFFLRYDF